MSDHHIGLAVSGIVAFFAALSIGVLIIYRLDAAIAGLAQIL